MPGSLHYEDRGKHLSPDAVADNFYAVSLGFKDVPAASTYYTAKLAFPTIGGNPNLLLIPGSQNQQIILQPLTTPASRIYLAVPSLTKTAAELKKRGIPFTTSKNDLTVTDPDGNALVFTVRP